ncbi:unnamed protein product [Schistosoma mattheei]|uniref:Uncharacterized protein n=1 Tax=Schistosoma mattheei TaxID=31246 RepID=A0AA85BG96_9TREM|nr:unnamed protein product [Schistosoma mattheei]
MINKSEINNLCFAYFMDSKHTLAVLVKSTQIICFIDHRNVVLKKKLNKVIFFKIILLDLSRQMYSLILLLVEHSLGKCAFVRFLIPFCYYYGYFH